METLEKKELTALELNAVGLDKNRTVLTPDYLENIKTKNQTKTSSTSKS